MPELPEVETTVRGIRSFIENQIIEKVTVRHSKLRWPIEKNIQMILKNTVISSVTRRAKYILINTKKGTIIIHLGMSGSLRIVDSNTVAEKHDYVDIEFSNQFILRFRDPRRFGAFLWTDKPVMNHSLLIHLGPEPLNKQFNAEYLTKQAESRNVAVKVFIMDSKVVVGIGNIYAAEALFIAGINPKRPAKNVSKKEYAKLVVAIKMILRKAIKKGGTTLKDFVNSQGNPGYFALHLKVYGKSGKPCENCNKKLELISLGQRSTVYCPQCQK